MTARNTLLLRAAATSAGGNAASAISPRQAV